MNNPLKSATNKATLSMKTQMLGDNLLPSIKKKTALHSKNPHRIKKKNPFKQKIRPERILDGFYLLEKSQCEFPHEVISVKLSNRNIIDCVESDLVYFENLSKLDLSENCIRDIRKLSALKALNRLEFQNNGLEDINFTNADGLPNLEELDLAYNRIRFSTIRNLDIHTKLRTLNLMGNELQDLPEDMSFFVSLEVLNISCNQFESNQRSSQFWSALASIPNLKDLDISRNLYRGIHTEKLIPGNFGALERLDFSYNRAENQHNLICTRNFKSLKVLIVTGNPFAFKGQHKGLEKEIYMRVGAILINDEIDLPHLKKSKKAKPPIRFNNLYTIQPDDLKKQAKNTFFGVELPPEEMEPVEKPETPIEGDESEEDEDEDEDQAKFFITEDEKKKKGKKSKTQKRYNQDDNQIEEGGENTEEYKDYSEAASSENKELYSGEVPDEEYEEEEQEEEINLEGVRNLDEFKKVANMLIGGESKDYDQPVEINTAYKLLRQVMKKSSVDKTLESHLSKASNKKSSERSLNNKSGKHNTVQARMLDVEFLIDELNRKMTTGSGANNSQS